MYFKANCLLYIGNTNLYYEIQIMKKKPNDLWKVLKYACRTKIFVNTKNESLFKLTSIWNIHSLSFIAVSVRNMVVIKKSYS